jgi:hypothetical protein
MRSLIWRRVLAVVAAPALILGFLSALPATPAAAYMNVTPIAADGYTAILDHFDGTTVGAPYGGITYEGSLPGLGSAARFDVGRYVRYSLGSGWSSQGTVEMWVRPDALSLTQPTGLLNGNWYYSTYYINYGGHVLHMGFSYPATGGTPAYAPYGSFWPSGNAYSDTAVIPGEWNHLALSWGSAGTKFYINGVLTNGSRANGYPDLISHACYAYLNYWGQYESGQAPLIGLIDEFHVSKIQRSDAYIARHAGTGILNGTFSNWKYDWSWTHEPPGSGYWEAKTGTWPVYYPDLPAPPNATSTAAVSALNSTPNRNILYQDFALAPAYRHTVNVDYYTSCLYCNWFTPTPDSLVPASPNQQFRIEVLKPTAPLDTVSTSDVIATLFRTTADTPHQPATTYQTASITLPDNFAGQVVRIRVVVVQTTGVITAGVTNFVVTSTPLTASTATTTALTSNANPSTYGQTVNLTATVSSPSGTPTGGVEFKEVVGPSETTIGTDALDANGVAHLPLNGLPPGTHTFKAYYQGATGFDPSNDSLTQTVNRAPSTTELTSDANPSRYGGPTVTLTAQATSSGGTPSGLLTFYEFIGASWEPISSGALDAAGTATVALPALSVGSHVYKAVYAGSVAIEGSDDTLTQVVDKALTTTHIGSITPAGPVTYSTPQTFTAHVEVPTDGGGGTPNGQVQFQVDYADDAVGYQDVGAPVTLSAGQADSAPLALPASGSGEHNVRAWFLGSTTHTESDATSAVATGVEVTKASSQTEITSVSPASPVTTPTAQTFTVTVAALAPASGTPTGSVQFTLDGANHGTPVTLSAGVADKTITVPVGNHTVSAVYSGDNNFSGSTATPEAVEVQTTTTTILATDYPLGAVYGVGVTFSADVSPIPGAAPYGSVTFYEMDGAVGTPIGSDTVDADGHAHLTISNLLGGWHTIEARYGGATYCLPSTSIRLYQHVSPAMTSVTVAAAPPSATHGTEQTLTATVDATASPATPTGSVRLSVDYPGTPVEDVVVATVVLAEDSPGIAKASTTVTLPAGTNVVKAEYLVDVMFTFINKMGDPLDVVVEKASTTTSISPLTSAAITYPATKTFTATVAAVAAGIGTPTGSVQFTVDGEDYGPAVALSSGVAATSIAAGAGTHSVTAGYLGDANFTGSSTGDAATFVVDKASTTVAYTGTYTGFHTERVSLSAVLSSPASACLTGRTVTFVVSLGATEVHRIAAVHTGSGKYAPPGTEYADWGEAEIYDVRVVVAESTNCLGTSTAVGDDVITVAERGDAANGGGWYQLPDVQGAQKRMNFGFTARWDKQSESYKGNLLLINKQAWRLKGAIDWYGIAGTSPLTAGASGTGVIYEADCSTVLGVTTCEWINPQTVTFSIAFTDVASGKSGRKSNPALVDNFALTNISWAAADSMESGLLPLKGGNITIATATAPKR